MPFTLNRVGFAHNGCTCEAKKWTHSQEISFQAVGYKTDKVAPTGRDQEWDEPQRDQDTDPLDGHI